MKNKFVGKLKKLYKTLLATDFYKISHFMMYPENTIKIYSNLTPRKSRIKDIDRVVVFGLQAFIKKVLIKHWNKYFFNLPKELVIEEFKRVIGNTLGSDAAINVKHIEELHDLGYLPIKIKALPEGSECPIGVPLLTITNTHPGAYWLVNYLETIISVYLWQPMVSATLSKKMKDVLLKYAIETTGSTNGVEWQGHDFSMRGMSSLETARLSGAGHLLSFNGTDTIPAILFLEKYYCADVEKEIIGASVPATEHSVMCMGTQEDELGTFRRLLNLYKEGILSIVSDTWNLWDVLTLYLPVLKDEILARNGKLVIRPDSGDPVDIICGLNTQVWSDAVRTKEELNHPSYKGVIELLWDVFGGTVNEQGYKVLDPHIGAIYGDSITIDRAIQICERLKAKGFASTNVVFGVGSYTYQYNTRDTFGFAVKATYGEIEQVASEDMSSQGGPSIGEKFIERREIFKNPITDDGTKKSAKGLLMVEEFDAVVDGKTKKHYKLHNQVTKEQEEQGALELVFLDGQLKREQSLADIKKLLS